MSGGTKSLSTRMLSRILSVWMAPQRKIVLKAIEKIRTNPLPQERRWIRQASWKQGRYGFDWLYENQAQGKWHSNRVPPHQN